MNFDRSMKYISAREFQLQLSRLVKKVVAGDSFIITDDETGKPIAEIVPVIERDSRIRKRPVRPDVDMQAIQRDLVLVSKDPAFERFKSDGLKLLWK